MTTDDSAETTRLLEGTLSLAVRRAGHATMARLLHELDRRGRTGPVPADLLPRHSAAVGEVVVGQELARLPEGWSVLHAVPIGREAVVDHLVIGPAGIVVIATQRRAGQDVRIGDRDHSFPRGLLGRSDEVRRVLGADVAVQPLLVLVEVAEPRRSGPQTVPAVRAGELIEHLLSLRPVLTPAQVRQAHASASRPRTWGLPASVLHEPDPTLRFLALAATPHPVPARTPHPVYEHRPHPAVLRARNGAACRAERTLRADRRALQSLLTGATVAVAPLTALVGAGIAAALLTR